MLTHIYIDGFKSFKDFSMEFTPLTVIAGVNGSGKSNLFDALKLLSKLSEDREIYEIFAEQRGNVTELFTRYSDTESANKMRFIAQLLVPKEVEDKWGITKLLTYTRLEYTLEISRDEDPSGRVILYVSEESLVPIKREGDSWLGSIIKKSKKCIQQEIWMPKVHGRGTQYISTDEAKTTISRHQDGGGGRKKDYIINNNLKQTILSGINSVDFAHSLAVKKEFASWRFMQLSPEDLRTPSSYEKWEGDIITQSGKNLSAALYRINIDDPYALKAISRRLSQLVGGFKEVVVENDIANKQYVISVIDNNNKKFSSRVLSEGTMRLLALCILYEDDKHTGLLCFEEPENGINPQRIHLIMDLLKDLSVDFADENSPLRQVIVNTHSPSVVANMVNWLGDGTVSVWLADMSNSNDVIGNERLTLSTTSMNEIEVELEPELPFDNIHRYTLSNALKYLETTDIETAKRTIQEAQNNHK